MKRKALIIMLGMICVFYCLAYAQQQAEYDAATEATKKQADDKGPRYKREMREVEKEYQEGSLTRTEYLQRKREIENMNP